MVIKWNYGFKTHNSVFYILQKYKSNKFQKKANNINKIKKQGAKIEKQKNQN